MPPDTAASPRPDVTDDAVLGGRLRLLQPRRGHRFGHDAILLAAATVVAADGCTVDLGAGVGAAGLALAVRMPGARVRLVEIDADLAALAAANIARNGLAGRAKIHVLDVEGGAGAFAAAGLAPASVDAVLMNPPFNDPARFATSPDAARRAAHMGDPGRLSGWIEAAVRLLRSGGILTLIHRADAQADIVAMLAGTFGDIVVLPVHPKPGAAPIRVIVQAVKDGRTPPTTLPGLLLQGDDGKPSPAAEDVLRSGHALPMRGHS
jgi:tRNA1(Val) A37 N6-methylase TrmN6